MNSAETSQEIMNNCGVLIMCQVLCWAIYMHSLCHRRQNAPMNYYPYFTLMQSFRTRKWHRKNNNQVCSIPNSVLLTPMLYYSPWSLGPRWQTWLDDWGLKVLYLRTVLLQYSRFSIQKTWGNHTTVYQKY